MPGKPGDEKRECEPGKRRLEDTWKTEEMNLEQNDKKESQTWTIYIRNTL